MTLPLLKSANSRYKASQELMDILLSSGFTDCTTIQGYHPWHQPKFYFDSHYYRFRKNGECVVSFLRDWSIHIINGPVSRWERFEWISEKHLALILFFSSLSSEKQIEFRTTTGKLRNYDQILEEVDRIVPNWKSEI